ncbi:MAG: archaeosortase/exosortase family protein [Phycisphaerae bacterium]
MSRRRSGRRRKPSTSPGPRPTPPTPAPSAVARFIGIFILIAAAGIGLEYYLMQTDGFRGYRTLVAEAGHRMSSLLGIDSSINQSDIRVGTRVLRVTPECTGVEAVGIFCAGVVAFPCGKKKTIVGLLIGFVGVGLLNILRITGLILVADLRPDGFEPAHDALTHLFPLFVVLPLWLCWLLLVFRGYDSAVRHPRGPHPGATDTLPANRAR